MQYSVELVKRNLRRLILDGYFRPEEPLPKVQDLARIFRVSLVTAQEAVHALRKEEVLDTKRGSGIFVRFPVRWKMQGKRILLLTSLTLKSCENKPYPAACLRALRDELAKDTFHIEEVSLREMELPVPETILGDGPLAGVVLLEVESIAILEAIRNRMLPVVSMDSDLLRMAIPSVTFDNLHAGYLATRRLQEHAHRRIAFVRQVWPQLRLRGLLGTYAPVDAPTDDRMRGYLLAMREAELPPHFVELQGEDLEGGIQELFARKNRPSALFCEQDSLAVTVSDVLEKLGFSTPADYSIMGLGGASVHLSRKCRLSSIGLDFPRLGRETARLLRETQEGAPPRRVVIPIQPDCGESVAAAVSQGAEIGTEKPVIELMPSRNSRSFDAKSAGR